MIDPIVSDVSLQEGPHDPEKAALFSTVVPVASISQTPEELLTELTLEEKVSLLSGKDFRTTPGIPRLGINQLCTSDGINGVRPAAHDSDMTTACFPNTTCLASTWDAELLGVMGERLVPEAFAKSSQFLLGPTINMHRDPRAGRNFECFSEDPLLSGQLAGAIVNTVQKAGVGSVPKHLVCNDSEYLRHFYNVEMSVNDRAMREIYLASWQHLLRTSDPVGLMMAYNKVDGDFCSENKPLMDLVRNEWGYKGIFMSDWFGTHNTVEPIQAGLDLEMPFPVWRSGRLIEAVKSGRVSQEELDARVLKMLEVRDRTRPSHRNEPEYSEPNEETIKVIRDLAAGGIVLLKNENEALPLKASKVAVIGEFAKKPVVTGGGSASCNPQYLISPRDALEKTLQGKAEVHYAAGVRTRRIIPMAARDIVQAANGKAGVDVKYFNDGTEEPVFVEQLDKAAVWMLGDGYRPGLKIVGSHLEMTTKLTPPSTGKHTLAVRATGDFSLTVDGKEVLTGKQPDVTTEQTIFNHTLLEFRSEVELTGGQAYDIKLNMRSRDRITVNEPTPYAATFCFEEYYSEADAIAEAAELAKNSETSIIFAGRDGQYESEGFDLESIKMPPNQTALIKAVAAVSKKTVLVLQSGNPIDVSDFEGDVDAILAAHFYGQEGPNAIADILSGKVNPSGRLATTWFKSVEDAPSFGSFPATKEADGKVTLKYTEGLQMGYRHPDASRVRYPFGHGLSYTTFQYEDLKAQSQENGAESKLVCSVKVSNTGDVAGREVVQLYVTPAPSTSVWRPQKELKAFKKILLQPGESKEVSLEVDLKVACSYWDEEKKAWSLDSGEYGVLVGSVGAKFTVVKAEVWNHL
ncbi:thermostable beta-glucosidase B [Pestalotiopsis sp. NC0098]|nr:thermostable beta-glucosidase B [Pestalotiopsis sp. NC0098]